MEVSRPLFFGAIALSVLSAASSAYLAFGRRAPTAVTAAGGTCACDDAALKREIADLRRAVDARGGAPGGDAGVKRLAARVAALESKSGVAAPADADDADDATSTNTKPRRRIMPDGQPVYSSFDPPTKALEIHQEPGGGLSVTNTDASLTGKLMLINARTEDGEVTPVPIIIPPPR